MKRSRIVFFSIFIMIYAACGGGDGGGTSNTAPSATDDSYLTDEDTALSEPAPGLLVNDTDPEGDTLSCIWVSGPSNGVLNLNTDGSFTYTPSNNFNGSDSFQYKTSDGAQDSNTATVSITVVSINDPPNAVDDSAETELGEPVNIDELLNDSDVEGTALSVVGVTQPSHGTVLLETNQTLTYTPALLYTGPDQFTYQVTDGDLDSNTATVYVTVKPLTVGTVGPFYPNFGRDWNDYIKNDGSTLFEASDTAATGTETGDYDVLLHGGGLRVFEVTGQSSCTGLTASDAVGAFEWVCLEDTDPVRFVSTGLKESANLSDLIDFSGETWLDNTVTVTKDGIDYGVTPSAPWWDNPIIANNYGGSLGTEGTIYVVTAQPVTGYSIGGSKIGLLVEPGLTMQHTVTPIPLLDVDGGATGKAFLWIEGSMTGTSLDNGVRLFLVRFSMVRNLEVDRIGGSGDAFTMSRCSGNKLMKISMEFNSHRAMVVENLSTLNSIEEFLASYNGIAILINDSSENSFSNLQLGRNSGSGIYMQNSNSNEFSEVVSSMNLLYGVYLFNSQDNRIEGLTASGNQYGIQLKESSGNVLNRVITGSDLYGVVLSQADDNILINVTANNNIDGVFLGTSSNNVIINQATVNNLDYGTDLRASSSNTVLNLASAHNFHSVLMTDSCSNNVFTGALKVGISASEDCGVTGGTDPGLDDETCIPSGLSDATLTTNVNMVDSFLAKVTTDDIVNQSDTDGSAFFDDITDWTGFENTYRLWGLDGGSFASTTHQGRPTNGDTCRIWDWNLALGDTGDSGGPVLLDVLSQPSETDSLTHIWSDASESHFLRNAVEITDDDVGNDDLLCEAAEDCIFTPNIGSYQGHGPMDFLSTVTLSGGDVNLYAYSTNGY